MRDSPASHQHGYSHIRIFLCNVLDLDEPETFRKPSKAVTGRQHVPVCMRNRLCASTSACHPSVPPVMVASLLLLRVVPFVPDCGPHFLVNAVRYLYILARTVNIYVSFDDCLQYRGPPRSPIFCYLHL